MDLPHGCCGIGIGCALPPLRRCATKTSGVRLLLLLGGTGGAITSTQGRLCADPKPGSTMAQYDRDRVEGDWWAQPLPRHGRLRFEGGPHFLDSVHREAQSLGDNLDCQGVAFLL